MTDEYKEVTTKSWGNRIFGSFIGAIVGIIFFIGAFPLIFWNEERSLNRIKTLEEGRSLVVAVSSEHIDQNNNNKLIHFVGRAISNEILKDPIFGVEENALKLKRIVEMYQWDEKQHSKTEKNLGGSETIETTYSYDKIWSEKLINSSNFKKREGHENPSYMPYKSEVYSAKNITIGAFKLTPPFIQQINKFDSYPISQKNFDTMDDLLKKSLVINGNTYFYGDYSNPQVGSMRISYEIIKPTEMSVIGKQDNSYIQTYNTKKGSINLLKVGNIDAKSMFTASESDNTSFTWMLRFGAFILMWMGLALLLDPIKVLSDVVPFIGSLIGMGIGLITGVLSLILSFITIAIAWIVYRPIIGITLLVLAVSLFLVGFRKIIAKLHHPKTI